MEASINVNKGDGRWAKRPGQKQDFWTDSSKISECFNSIERESIFFSKKEKKIIS